LCLSVIDSAPGYTVGYDGGLPLGAAEQEGQTASPVLEPGREGEVVNSSAMANSDVLANPS
jgi:hypothetical protein